MQQSSIPTALKCPAGSSGTSREPVVADFEALADSTFPRSAKSVDPQLRWQIEQIAACGGRAIYELILELREASTARGWFDNRIATYASLRREQLKAIGADRFPDHLAAIDGGRR